jgi:hypothetical protein
MQMSSVVGVLLSVVAAGGTLAGCGGSSTVREPPAAGAGGEDEEGTGGAGPSTGSGGSSAESGNGGSLKGGGSSTGGRGVNEAGTTGDSGGMATTGGTGGMATTGGNGGMATTGGTGGMAITGGMGGMTTTGGMGGMATTGGTGGSAPYSPRSGPFKMLVYSKTSGYRHVSISAGKTMLQEIGAEQNFQVVFTEANDEFNAAGLGQYEIVFFMNSSGSNFTATEKQAYETWMTTKDGAFGGVHSATDTEPNWVFYSEVTGQYNDLHDTCCTEASIQWDSAALDFVAVRGLPNPWVRSEEWIGLKKADAWSEKPGFKILSRVTTARGTRPVSYVREWGNFRSFYTALGHKEVTFQDADVKKHIAAGIMWAVRREHLLE